MTVFTFALYCAKPKRVPSEDNQDRGANYGTEVPTKHVVLDTSYNLVRLLPCPYIPDSNFTSHSPPTNFTSKSAKGATAAPHSPL